MSYDGDRHGFSPASVLSHTPEEPYIRLFDVLETVYGYSQETARLVATKLYLWTPYRAAYLTASMRSDYGSWVTEYDQTILLARPCDTVTAVLAFRPALVAASTVGLRVTVDTSTGAEVEISTTSAAVVDPETIADRDLVDLQYVSAFVDTSAIDLSAAVRVWVELEVTTPIIPEHLLIYRSA